MTLTSLTKPQYDAAKAASRALTQGSPNRASDRAAYQLAKAHLSNLLPACVDADEVIREAVRQDMRDSIATICAGLPVVLERGR